MSKLGESYAGGGGMWRKKPGVGQNRCMRQRQLRMGLSRNGNYTNMVKIMKSRTKYVFIAKEDTYAELYKQLDTAEGNNIIYKYQIRNRRTTYICDNIVINDKEGQIKTETTKITDGWKEHYVEL